MEKMKMDYETSVFVNDCREASTDNVIGRNKMIEIFWMLATDLRTTMEEQGKVGYTHPDYFPKGVYDGLCETLKVHGVTVREEVYTGGDVWPFHDVQSGNEIQKDRFYGFGDSGSLAGNAEGYETEAEARADLMEEGFSGIQGEQDFGTLASQIGDKTITICTGWEFVAEMRRRCKEHPEDDADNGLASIGHFVDKCNDDCPLWIDPGSDLEEEPESSNNDIDDEDEDERF